MYADVERFSYQEEKHFLRVLEQQGRVSLAADWNEQAAILLRYLQTLARDLIGPYGTPANDDGSIGDGFKIGVDGDEITIAPGRYWVDGLVCRNHHSVGYNEQPELLGLAPQPPLAGDALVYIDAWERHVVSAQDDSIRDVALGGPDTCSRSKLVWQVKLLPLNVDEAAGIKANIRSSWSDWRMKLDDPAGRGLLAVKVDKDMTPPDPCQAPPGAGYFGPENQLYRVEIHRGSADPDGEPTFKWSRDNGSVIYPLREIEGTTAVLRDPPLDCRRGLADGVLVEVVDDHSVLLDVPGPLARVVHVDDDGDDVVVHLSDHPAKRIAGDRHPLLRRWDQPDVGGGDEVPLRANDGALVVVESTDGWFTLEDGIQIRFAPLPAQNYRSGDYWTFPARVATGDVTWRADAAGNPLAVPPHGIRHHYGPLAVVTFADHKATGVPTDLRLGFKPLAS